MQCYNKGCGQIYTEEQNRNDSCKFHPGVPVFHDAYKKWSCCNNKSTDFTTFLHMPGCTTGQHNPNKPVEQSMPKQNFIAKSKTATYEAPLQKAIERPHIDLKLESLKIIITPSLKNVLKEDNNIDLENNSEDGSVQLGEICKNNACKKTYEAEHSDVEMCQYHPGIPVFHEGMKYWSCCQRKTTDFDMFMEQQGCTSGSHTWIKKDIQKCSCRFDWYQTPTYVYLTLYAKLPHPELSTFELNSVRLKISLTFSKNQQFDLNHELFGIVSAPDSSVTMAASKIEVKLKKAEPVQWKELFVIEKVVKNDVEEKILDKSEVADIGIEAIDLNDL